INPLASSVHYHAPLLLIVGESPASKDRTTQNLDQRTLSEAIGAGFKHVASGQELEERFWAAIQALRWNGCPQVLSIGDGVLEAEATLSDGRQGAREFQQPAPKERIAAAVTALAGAKRPLILAGQGAVLADCRGPLEKLANLVGARVGSTIN